MFTRHNNFEVPSGGVQNWDASLNENFELAEKGQTIKATAGITLAVGKVVYMNSSERLMLAISPSGTTTASQFLGFTTALINQEVDGYVQINGNHKWPHWSFTPGPVYLDATTAGEVTQTQPTVANLVGYAIGTNEIAIRSWVDPSLSVTPAHSNLTSLVDPADDHTQYLATDNRRSTSGLTVTGPFSVDNITPESNPYITIQVGLTVQASSYIRTGAEDLQTVLSLDQGDYDQSFIEFTGLAVTGGTSSIDLSTGELGAVFGKAQVKVNGVTKWIRLYDDVT
jgi:hypothetical protein